MLVLLNGVAERKIRTLIEATRTMALVIKPHNKTPYELIRGRPPPIDFMKPFGWYYVVSKAMRVFNKKTRIVEETLNIRFLKNAPNVKGNGPDWLFDIDSSKISMNYVPVVVGFQTNGIARTKYNIVAGPKDSAVDAGKKATEVDESQVSDNSRKDNQVTRIPIMTPINDTGIFGNAYDDEAVEEEVDINNVVSSYTIPDAPLTKFLKDHHLDQVFKNKKVKRGIVIKNKARLVTQGHTQEEGIDYDEVFLPVARIEAIRLFLAYASFKDFVFYQIDVKSAFLYGNIEEEVYVCQPPGFKDPDFPDKVYKVEKDLYGLHQAPRTWKELIQQKSDGIFINQNKYVADILKRFGFSTVKTTSTPMKPNKALVKDAEAKDVDVHLYRSMIGSLMYLTTSKPNITFAVCACARDSPFDLKAYSDSDYTGASLDRKSTTGGCHFLGKRLISWQCKKQTIVGNSTTEVKMMIAKDGRCLMDIFTIKIDKTVYKEWEDRIERTAFTASSLEAKQDNGNINRTQFMATLIEPFPHRTGSGSGPSKGEKVNVQEQIQALVNKQKVIIIKDSIRHDLQFDDAERTACLPNDSIFAELARMGTKTIAWHEFSSTMASAIIYLANNHKFIFSKYIFDNMVKHLEGGVKFLMFPRFLQVFLDKQVKGMAKHKELYVISSHTKKLFEVGEGLGLHTDSHHTPTDTQPSLSKSQKKIKLKRKQRQATEVLDLEKAKIAQAKETAKLKKRVKKLEKRRKSRPAGPRRLKKVGSSKQVESTKEKDSLGAQEDASKQRRSIKDIDQDAEIALVDEAQERMHDADMFRVDELEGNEVFVDAIQKIVEKEVNTVDPVTTVGEVVTIASVKDSPAPTTTTTADVDDEVTLEKTLIAIKAAKPKDKGKAKMIKPEKPLKKRDQIALNEEVARKRKYLAAQKAEEIMNKPPIKAQQKSLMCTYMRNMEGFKQKDFKGKRFDDIKKIFDKVYKRVNTFMDMDTENMEESLKKTQAKGNFKRARQELKCLKIVPEDDDDVAIKATPISSKSPTIVDYKIYREGKKSYFKIIRADGNSENYLTFRIMFKNFNREDLEVLRSIVKERFKKTKPADDMENLLFQTLKTMFEPHVKDII
uniref:Reverse transcriptase Ty1/copia-type domain-containing protein n=1 Tax=Tanacetum cinerariifolium TaxID=118510 RepID=A0A6L2NW49_TANCI|nr:hypothetical protein [Tanacetum cinerariifolium]